MTVSPPGWVSDSVFYTIFPDRFASSASVPKPSNLEPWDSPPTTHGFKGGDLMGIVERLDYLQDLGINALYLNPIFQSTANHRYHTHDYLQVDPMLGGNVALERLLNEAHRRGMYVMLDGVFNHASRGFFQFNSLLEAGEKSPYLDWFTVHGWPLNAYNGTPNYSAWWGLPDLPKLNTTTPAVREFLWSVGSYWMEKGIDGWRLDVPTEIADDSFWQEFRRRVRGVNPNAYLLAEIWHEAQHYLRGDQFDATMNYQIARACIGLFVGADQDRALTDSKGYSPVDPLDARGFGGRIEHLLSLYEWPVNLAQFNLLDSHDTGRYLSIAQGDQSALRLALLFLMTYPGAPNIYYGTEVGLLGGNDPDCRRAMPWDESQWNVELRDYVKRAIVLRREYPALRSGRYQTLWADEMVYAFGRQLDDEVLVVAFNAGKSTAAVEIPAGGFLSEGARLDHVWQAHGSHSVVGGFVRDLHLPPRSGVVLKVA